MAITKERELQTRIDDLEQALASIGRIVADETIAPKRRLDQVTGICKMYETAGAAK